MQAALRAWVHRVASMGARGFRGIPSPVLLSLVCAATFSPLIAAVAGLGAAAAVAGSGVLSSVGGGVLSEIISSAVDQVRAKGKPGPLEPDAVEQGIADEIGRVLASGGAQAHALRAEIALVLREVDAGGVMLRAAMERGDERVRTEVIAAIGGLGSDFVEMGFLIGDVARAAAQIQESLDVQGADVRTIIEQNRRQSADIRQVRDDVALIARRTRTGGSGDRGPIWAGECPYRGLLPFEETDADIFYGRARLTAELAVRVAGRAGHGGIVVVTGASGAGKSSLLRAGLLPKLAQGRQVAGAEHWPQIVMTPTRDPFTELAAHLAALGGSDTIAVRDRLVQQPGQAHLSAWTAILAYSGRRDAGQPLSSSSAPRLVLVIDQFEQVFTLSPDRDAEDARAAFVTALYAMATSPVGPRHEPAALVIIAVRGDFYDRCAVYPELADALQEGQFVVGPMTESDLRLAITGPAEAAGLRIDQALTDTILGDLRVAGDDRAGVLPLLSQAMALTWDRREGDQLTTRGYDRAGGVGRAVQTSADHIYDALSSGQQVLAQQLLRSMAVASRDRALTRRPVSRAELYAGRHDVAHSQIDAVLEAFAAERLIVLNGDTAQIAHDALLSEWPKLRGWLEEDQASWILHGQLADDAASWHDNNADPSFLYRGTQLATVQQAATRWSAEPARSPALTPTQHGFLNASQRIATRSTRQRRAAAAVLIALTLAASIASVFALQQRTSAFTQRNQAIYNEVVAEALQASSTDPSLAAQLDLAAYQMQPDSGLGASLLNTENTPLYSLISSEVKGSAGSVAFSPDGHTMATGDGPIVRLWHVNGTARPKPLGHFSANEVITTLAFSKDGRTLASGGPYDPIRLWNITDPAHPKLLSQPFPDAGDPGVNSVAFSHDGLILASGGNFGTVRLWNVADPARPRRLGQLLSNQGSPSVAFSPHGRTLAVGSNDGSIKLWNLDDPDHPQLLDQVANASASRGVVAITVSPDGHTLASGDEDGTIRLWNITNPARPQPLGQLSTGSASNVDSIAFSPDGQTLASGDWDGTIRLWNVTDPARPQPLEQLSTGSASNVDSIAFSPDSQTLASGYYDGTVRLWNIPQAILAGSTVQTVAFSPVSHTLASGQEGTIRLWNIADPAHPRPLGQVSAGTGSVITSVAFSPDGRILASSQEGTIRLWKVDDPVHPQPLGQVHTGAGDIVNSLAFSPRANTLASASGGDGTIQLWNIADPARPHQLGQLSTENTYAVAFSPDGRMLAESSYSGAMGFDFSTVQLWNVSDPANPQPFGPALAGNLDFVRSVAFSSDGRTLAIGVDDGTIRMWNVAHPGNPKPLGHPLTTNTTNVVTLAAFMPDSDILVTSGENGTVRLWNISDPRSPKPLGRPLTTNTTSFITSLAFSPDGILASSNDDGTISLWNLNISTAIKRICATTANDLTPQLWHTYIPQLPYKPPCQ